MSCGLMRDVGGSLYAIADKILPKPSLILEASARDAVSETSSVCSPAQTLSCEACSGQDSDSDAPEAHGDCSQLFAQDVGAPRPPI